MGGIEQVAMVDSLEFSVAAIEGRQNRFKDWEDSRGGWNAHESCCVVTVPNTRIFVSNTERIVISDTRADLINNEWCGADAGRRP